MTSLWIKQYLSNAGLNESTDWKSGFGKRRTPTHKDTWDDPNFDKDFPGVKEKMIDAKKKSAERLSKWFKDHPIKEETQIDELSDKVLNNYRWAAIKDIGKQTIDAIRNDDKKALKKAQNRQAGVTKARLRMAYRKSKNEETLDESRKISDKIAKAFLSGSSARGKNTYTDGKAVYLHNNKIAWHGEGGVHMTHAGWGTTTTKERLNTIADHMGHGRPFYTKKHSLHHDDKEIGSRDVVFFKHKGVNEGVTNWGMVRAIRAANERRAKNPVAKDLRSPKYKKRVVSDKTAYTRKQKHKNRTDEGVIGTLAAFGAIGALGAYQAKQDKKKTSNSVASGIKSAGKVAAEETLDEISVGKAVAWKEKAKKTVSDGGKLNKDVQSAIDTDASYNGKYGSREWLKSRATRLHKRQDMIKKVEKRLSNTKASLAKEETLDEIAKSRAQRRLMGWAWAIRKGETDRGSEKVTKIAADMDPKELRKFAKTKEKGLPNRVKKGKLYGRKRKEK